MQLPHKESIIVVCASDNNYAMQLAVTGRSAIENLNKNRKIQFFVIDGGITEHNKQKVLESLDSSKCDVSFIKISEELFQKIKEAHKPLSVEGVSVKAEYVSIASFYRLLIPEFIPQELDKVIYLDCDLVVKGDLAELWATDLGDNFVLAAQDTWIPQVSSSTSFFNYQKLGIAPNCKYFNAGVLVINLKKWRDHHISEQAVAYFISNFEDIGWYDQGVLNGLLAGKWGELDPRWNMSPSSVLGFSSWRESPFSEEVYNQLVRSPFIVHFVSEKKPWNSRHTLYKEYFFQYVDKTRWAGWRLTLLTRLRLRLAREFKAFKRKLNLKVS